MYNPPAPMAAQPKRSIAAYIPYFFLVGAIIGAIGCLGRADYNLPVFLFAYIAWSYLKGHKYIVMVIFLFSLIIDVLWFIFIYLIIINRDDYNNLAPWESGIQKCSMIVMLINFVIKIVSIVISFFFDPEVRTQMNNPQTGGMGGQMIR